MPREKWSETRKIVSMPAGLIERVKRFRFDNEINTESEAIRILIERGLDAAGQGPQAPVDEGRKPDLLAADNDD